MARRFPPDGDVTPIAPRVGNDPNLKDVVAFHGWLGAGEGGREPAEGDAPENEDPNLGYRLYTTRSFDRWLAFKSADLVHHRSNTNGTSYVWIKADARIAMCHAATACRLHEQIRDDPDDPSAADYPKYP